MPNVKGSALAARMKWVELHQGSTGIDRLLEALPDADRRVASSVILPSDWYPFGTFVRVVESIDALFGKGDLALVPAVAGWAAGENLPTLYRFFYRVGTVGFVLSMATRLWRMHYDAGELVVDSGAGRAKLSIVGWPEPAHSHCLSVQGWVVRAAELSGAKDVKTQHGPCRARGGESCSFDLSWS